MFDDVVYGNQKSIAAIKQKQELGEMPLDYVVLMDRCKDHYFHLECLLGQLGSNTYLECTTCFVTYGIKTGD